MPNIPQFDPYSDPPSVSIRWERWRRRFEDAMTGFNITSTKRQRALLLHYGGEDLQDVFDTLDNTGTENEIKPAFEALTKYFTPNKNTVYETIIFREAVQEDHETVDQFCTRLRKMAKKCDFADPEKEIQIQILSKCRSTYLRKRALEKERSLGNLLELARTIELSESRAQRIVTGSAGTTQMTGLSEPVCMVCKLKANRLCYKCGFNYPHENRCPAEGQQCRSCGEMNHFARCCRNSTTQTGGNRSPKETHTKQGNAEDRVGKLLSNEALRDQAEQVSNEHDCNAEEYVYDIYMIKQDSYQSGQHGKNSHQRETFNKNSNQRVTSDKNTHKREISDKNSYQRETFNKNSNQRDTSDKNTHKRETPNKKSHQRGNVMNKNSYKDVEKKTTSGNGINKNSYKDEEKKTTGGNVINKNSYKDVEKESTSGKHTATTTVHIGAVKFEVCADTGSPQNLIGEDSFQKIQDSRPGHNKIKLRKSDVILRPYYTKKSLPIVGKFEAIIETNTKMTVASVYVVKGSAENLLSKQTSEDLDLVNINIPHSYKKREVN